MAKSKYLDLTGLSKFKDKIVSLLESHTSDNNIHTSKEEKGEISTAYSHSTSVHAPTDAEKNIIVGVQKNGSDLSVNNSTRKVNITVPTKVSDLTNDSGYLTEHQDISGKLDKNQGVSNSGKIAGINESGDIVPMFPQGVTYNEDTQCLEYGADEKLNLNVGIQLDDTLSKVGYAADAAKVGELKSDLDELDSRLSESITEIVDKGVANLYNKSNNIPSKNISDDRTIADSQTRDLSELIYIGLNTTFTVKTATNADNTGIKKLAWCDENGTIKSLWNNADDTPTHTFNSGDTPCIRFTVMKQSENFSIVYGSEYIEVDDLHGTMLKDSAQSKSFRELEERFAKITEFTPQELLTGFIRTNVAKISTTVVENDAYRHIILKCKTGDVFKIMGAGGESPLLWCFTDSSYNQLKHSSINKIIREPIELVAESDGYIICNFSLASAYEFSVKSIYTFDNAYTDIKTNDLRLNGVLMFGRQADNNFVSPVIDALEIPPIGERLEYFYGLFDALVSAYPNYVKKVNCDTECAENGIPTPSYMSGYPIYMYTFKPPFAPNNTNITVKDSNCDIPKVMIIGGSHPEYTAIWDMYHMMRLVCENWQNDVNLDALRWECEIYVMPCQASWCVEKGTRYNYNHVNVNRNMATKDFEVQGVGTDDYTGAYGNSEYESKVLAYYIDKIKPHIFVDHHNTNISDTKNLVYSTCPYKTGIDIAGSHISAMTRKYKKKYPDTFPMDDVIYGWTRKSSSTGLRSVYACEHGALGFTFETNDTLCYRNGVYHSEGVETNTSMVCTLATDSFTNFIVRVLKEYCQQMKVII